METVTARPASGWVEGGAERRASPPRLWASLSQMLASQVLLGLCGLASLPILARNLGPESYGRFSLFLVLLGVLVQVDFSRPLLVRELAAGGIPTRGRAATTLVSGSLLFLAPLVLAVGWLFLAPGPACALTCAAVLHVAASAPYARLCAEGRVGVASAVRNTVWAVAFGCTVVASFGTTGPAAWMWSFTAANAVILVVCRRLSGAGGPIVARPDLAQLARYRRQSLDLIGFGLAAALVATVDKLILERNAPDASFGRYVAQYDLAVKVNILSTALGHVLYPTLSRRFSELGYDEAARFFVRTTSFIALGYFALILPAIVFGDEIVELVLGTGYAGSFEPYGVILLGVFLHLFGFLITPWQRACGDFRTQRRAYFLSGALMLAVGLVLIPRYGLRGAALTYLTARTAELALILVELARLPRTALSRARMAGLFAMTAALATAAGWRLFPLGGAS